MEDAILVEMQDFRDIWLLSFDFDRPPGERPRPIRLRAREHRSGRQLCLEQGELGDGPPFPTGPEVLTVFYDAPAHLGCYLALGWPLPERVLDLQAEFRWLTSGLEVKEEGPGSALAYLRPEDDGGEVLPRLLECMLPKLDLPRALLRGRYTAAVASMEAVGVPLDVERFTRLREGWGWLREALIERVDRHYGVFKGGKFLPQQWRAWLNRNHIRWPRLGPGKVDLKLETFRDMAEEYPQVRPMKELMASLSQLKLFRLAVGRDGRSRTPLRPFASKTGRNQPSTAAFIFGPAVWVRGLIKPAEGMALAYVDYEQQEFGIAAALSGDPAMTAAYKSGDPYLTFAKQARAVPEDATKASHREERERFKGCALGVQYGMQAWSLGVRLGIQVPQASKLLALHRRTYATYWQWSEEVEREALRQGRLQAAFGWTLNVGSDAKKNSVRNFPLQANGAEMLRLACCLLTETGVRVCAPVHDALLIEAPADDIDEAVASCQRAMEEASKVVLDGFTLRTEAKVVAHPERYMDPRGCAMWDDVFRLLDEETVAVAALRQAVA